jgi:hypothetical protein
MPGAVVTRGASELSLRFESFPAKARAILEQRIVSLTSRLQSAVEEAAPKRTGKLASEIVERIFADQASRVAGYVQVYAPQSPDEYAKAATLEYGSNKPRRLADHGGIFRRLGAGQRRIESRLTKPTHIEAFRYLHGPFEELKPQMQEQLQAALQEAIDGGDA